MTRTCLIMSRTIKEAVRNVKCRPELAQTGLLLTHTAFAVIQALSTGCNHGSVRRHRPNHDGERAVWDVGVVQFDVQVVDAVLFRDEPAPVEPSVHLLGHAVVHAARRSPDSHVQLALGAVERDREGCCLADLFGKY